MPVVLYYGGDSYRMKRGLELLRAKGEYENTDVTRLDARRVPTAEILMTVGTAGLFSSRRLIILDSFGAQAEPGDEQEPAKSPSKPRPGDVLTMEALMAVTPSDTTVVILGNAMRSNSAMVADGKKRQKAGEPVTVQELPLPKEKTMAAWFQDQARKQNVKIDARAAALLAQRVGNQVEIGGAELEKLKMAVGPDGVIDSNTVEDLVPDTAESSIFPLIEAISSGRRTQAIGLLRRQLSQARGNDQGLSLQTLALLARQFRILLRIQLLKQAGVSEQDITETLRLPSYFAGQYFAQSARFSRRQLYSVFEGLAALDHAIKNGEAGAAVLDLLVAGFSDAGRSLTAAN